MYRPCLQPPHPLPAIVQREIGDLLGAARHDAALAAWSGLEPGEAVGTAAIIGDMLARFERQRPRFAQRLRYRMRSGLRGPRAVAAGAGDSEAWSASQADGRAAGHSEEPPALIPHLERALARGNNGAFPVTELPVEVRPASGLRLRLNTRNAFADSVPPALAVGCGEDGVLQFNRPLALAPLTSSEPRVREYFLFVPTDWGGSRGYTTALLLSAAHDRSFLRWEKRLLRRWARELRERMTRRGLCSARGALGSATALYGAAACELAVRGFAMTRDWARVKNFGSVSIYAGLDLSPPTGWSGARKPAALEWSPPHGAEDIQWRAEPV